ncbi:gelsolin-like protein 1 [Mizuhopecten yessoensis]|uniref:Actin-modulator n=1 Tax=Mizuhopecten yessoensis TaxID=6573 RepID=A0A210Q191_MIZYE|nr:gelsolin-like protein 1 [Mizuhopecten yessoensis]XP_021369893.1 gelsolin-like protein 1 [Mizuhopecten yessoensis]XP_021369894.1 gelsolin-like protein 1 [Mizuhopecten yessoensis]OWF42511.1 Gelsolin-like protein 1 [Mizuhopecten yessoensis]
MSGLVKAKTYDWKDSNMALFGSDTDKQVKKESAETEPAWEGAGQAVGLKVWRIKAFEVESVPEEEYGEFYKGDSYIILNTYQKPDSDALLYDVHFWIGESSSQDEYGTAAYKTVELDTLLDDKAVQHREVQGCESETFLSYFDDKFEMLNGGHASGFRHVDPVEYQPRLLCIQYTNGKAVANEVQFSKCAINSDDVFIFDSGTRLVQLNGSKSAYQEKTKAAQLMSKFSSERPEADKLVADEGDSDYRKCVDSLGDDGPEEKVSTDDGEVEEPVLLKVTDEDGSIGTEPVKTGGITMDDFSSDAVFLLHVKRDCFVWVGNDASIGEKRNGMAHASKYLQSVGKPFHRISVRKESDENNASIEAALAA